MAKKIYMLLYEGNKVVNDLTEAFWTLFRGYIMSLRLTFPTTKRGSHFLVQEVESILGCSFLIPELSQKD